MAHQWNEPGNGGVFTRVEEFRSANKPSPEKAAADEQLRIMAMALAVAQYAGRRNAKAEGRRDSTRRPSPTPEPPPDAQLKQREPESKAPDKPSDMDRTTEKVILQALTGFGGKLLAGHSLSEIIEDLRLSKETSAIWNTLGYGAFHHIMGAAITSYVQMKLGEAIASLWKVDDTDSMGEQLAHHAAFDLFWKMKGSLLSAAPFGDLPFLSPTSGTEWANWWNGIFNGVGSHANFPMAYRGSAHAADGTIMSGAGTVWVEGNMVARLGDEAVLAKPSDSGNVVATGFPTVTIEGIPVAVANGSDFVLGKSTGTMAPITVGAVKTLVGFPPAAPSTDPKGAPGDSAALKADALAKGIEAAEKAGDSWFSKYLEPWLGIDGAGQYTALFGSVVLGSPEFPGAGTYRDSNDYKWLVPDVLFGFDMSAYYVYHDANFGTTDGVAGEEIPAFGSGIVGAGSMSQVPIQAIYSLATTIANILQRDDQFKKTKTWPPEAQPGRLAKAERQANRTSDSRTPTTNQSAEVTAIPAVSHSVTPYTPPVLDEAIPPDFG